MDSLTAGGGGVPIQSRAVQVELLLALTRVYVHVGVQYAEAGGHSGGVPAASAWAMEEVLWERWYCSPDDAAPGPGRSEGGQPLDFGTGPRSPSTQVGSGAAYQ